jgi:predicted RNase H-like nuclease (RuvC/YqgF family)
MQLTPEMIVSLGAMAASVITSFAIVKTKVNQIEDDLKEAYKRLAKLDSRLDRNDTATDLNAQRLSVISGMMDPQNRERLHRSLERLQVESETLRRDVDKLSHMHNGRHAPVKNYE